MGDENPSGEPDHYAWKKMWGGEEVGVPFDGLASHSGEKQYSCSLYTNLLKKTLMCSSALSHLAFISAHSSSPYMWVAFLAFISRCKVYYAALLAWFFSFWSEHIAQN